MRSSHSLAHERRPEGNRLGHDAATSDASTRDEARVRSRSDWRTEAENISSVQRQRQLPSALPGWFIRASLPRLRTSCNGAIASAATDDHARPNKADAASVLVPPVRFR
jgi:hypothetical protein